MVSACSGIETSAKCLKDIGNAWGVETNLLAAAESNKRLRQFIMDSHQDCNLVVLSFGSQVADKFQVVKFSQWLVAHSEL
jgi:hypothetical protein